MKEHLQSRFAEWTVGAALICWGLIVLSNPTLFATTSIYSAMTDIAPQTIWGYTAVLIGLLRITFLIINGTWRRSAHLRAIGSGLSACLWAALWSSYFALDNPVPNLATIGALLALDIYSVWFAAADAKHSDLRSEEDRLIVKRVRQRDHIKD